VGRRVKILTEAPSDATDSDSKHKQRNSNGRSSGGDDGGKSREETKPTASLTEPEAAWMLATSRKRWEPCFNADISLTRDGIIVSQFLTNDSTDYHHFAPALAFVTATLGKPEDWVGDGHYGTEVNLALAEREGVVLYAPRPGLPDKSADPSPEAPRERKPRDRRGDTRLFGRQDFSPHPDRDALVCPAKEELPFVGEYPRDNGIGTYRLYGRRNCIGCRLKEQCTRGRGRRLRMPGSMKVPAPHSTPRLQDGEVGKAEAYDLARLFLGHAGRMAERGDELLTLRGYTCEAANANLKQHGVSRFHVRGMARCGVVLTLACVAHNLMKWAAKAATQRMKLAS